MTSSIGIIGSGGQADEAESFFRGAVLFRAVTKDYISDGLIDVENPDETQKQTPVIIAIGSPGLRRDMSYLWSGVYGSVVAAGAYIDKTSDLGEGAIVAPNSVLTTNVHVGRHSIINVGASIQHDSILGDFITIGPGVRIGGHATIGDGVFVGIGAVIKNNISIARGVVVGAGAVVVDNLEVENGVYVGVPAKCIKVNKDWLYEI